MRGIAQPGAILRNVWKQCSNSKYGVGVKIGEVWELGVIVLHHFDIPTPNMVLVVILTVNRSVGVRWVIFNPLTNGSNHKTQLVCIETSPYCLKHQIWVFCHSLLSFLHVFLPKQMQRALVTCPEV